MSEADDTVPQSPSPPAQPAVDDSSALAPAQEDAGALVEGDGTKKRKIKKIIRKKLRPARPQVDKVDNEPPPQIGKEYNIWYNKWSGGDREDAYLSKTHAKSRCNLAKDTGYTRADSVPGSFICLFFARGLCPRGQDCEYLHRGPTTFDVYSGNADCFGRDKHSDYRDDMGGVGSFMRQNRTLYIGRVHPTDDIEEIVARHFQEWGTIERTRVLPARGVAFVTYTTEALAQFAKEAMAHQSLDNEEVLNVRWATQDPNPAAQKREVRKIEEQAADAIRRALPDYFVADAEGRDPDAKRRRKELGTFGLEGYEATDQVWFETEKAARALENNEQNAALEGPPAQSMIEAWNEPMRNASGGLLGSSTLAAIEQFKAKYGGLYADENESPGRANGPLVNYGEEEDRGPAKALVDYVEEEDDEW